MGKRKRKGVTETSHKRINTVEQQKQLFEDKEKSHEIKEIKEQKEKKQHLPETGPPDSLLRPELQVLAKLHPHEHDQYIWFDDRDGRHDYYVDWKQDGNFTLGGTVSSTTFKKKYFPCFDADKVICQMRNGEKLVYK